MLSILLFAIVSALGGPADPPHTTSLAADSVLVSVDAVKRGTTGVMSNPPKDVATQRSRVAVFGGRKDIRTEDGKIVNGMGFLAWRQNHSVVVAVFVLVPGKDQLNTNFTDAADYRQLAHRHLINYVLKGSEAVVVKEAASLGYGTTTIQLVPPAAP